MNKQYAESHTITSGTVPALLASPRLLSLEIEEMYSMWRVRFEVVGRRGQLCNVLVLREPGGEPGIEWYPTVQQLHQALRGWGVDEAKLQLLRPDRHLKRLHVLLPDKTMLCGLSQYAHLNGVLGVEQSDFLALSPNDRCLRCHLLLNLNS